jgi:hypothetical protein
MPVEQWTDDEWKQLEAKFESAPTRQEQDKLIELTRSQEEHPEWYDQPCLCQLCCSYGD